MTRLLVDLSKLGYGRSPARTIAAVENWLLEVVQAGGWPHTTWDAAIQGVTVTAAQRLETAGADVVTWLRGSSLTIAGRWILRNASWSEVLRTIVAALPGEDVHAAQAQAALTDYRTMRTQVTITEFTFRSDGKTVSGLIAAVAGAQGLHLFDPRAGIYEVNLAASDAGRTPLLWFVDHMRDTYGARTGKLSCNTYLVDITDVYFTWFGPPAAQPSVEDGSWPDIKGPVAVARAGVSAGRAPRVKFCCLAQHRDAFEQKFRSLAPGVARSIEVRAIDEQFAGGLRPGGALAAPDYANIPATVRSVIARSLAMAAAVVIPADVEAAKEAKAIRTRHLVNAKNVWSLYCVYEFGGYHMDTGMVMADGAIAATLDPPDRFALMWVDEGPAPGGGNAGTVYQHVTVPFGHSGVHCLTIVPNSEGNPLGLVDNFPTPGNLGFERIDVPVIRSPRRSIGISLALRAYLEFWFRLQEAHLSVHMQNATYAAIIVTAAVTGLSHPTPPSPGNCGYVQPSPGTNLFRPRDLGLRKTGQQSHRIIPVPIGS